MKPEFPNLYAKASMVVATPLIGFVGCFYVARATTRPAPEVYGFGVVAFSVTAALSGICLRVPESVHGSSSFQYAGEKFLHSAVLLLQTVMLVYAKAFFAETTWLSDHPWLGTIVRAVPLALIGLLSAAAAWTWHHAFDVVNSQLWRNWEERLGDQQGSSSRQ
jgi:hypothetical protein